MRLTRSLACALAAAALALGIAMPASADAAVKIELSGTKAKAKCAANHPLRQYGSWICMTEDVRVVAPGGAIGYTYKVVSAKGCTEVGAIVRTTGRTGALASFTERLAAPGTTARGKLTRNLSTIDRQLFEPKQGKILKLSIQMPWDSCDDLSSFKVVVRFPKLTKAS